MYMYGTNIVRKLTDWEGGELIQHKSLSLICQGLSYVFKKKGGDEWSMKTSHCWIMQAQNSCLFNFCLHVHLAIFDNFN